MAPDLSSWAWKDEDELVWTEQVGLLAPAEAAAVRAEGERAVRAVEERDWPYRDGWERWTPDPAWPVPELPDDWLEA